MGFLGTFLSLLRFSLECYIGTYIFTTTLRRRDGYCWRLAGAFCANLALQLLLTLLWSLTGYNEALGVLLVAVIAMPCNIGWMLFSYDEQLRTVLFCGILGLLTQRGATKLLDVARGLSPAFSRADALFSGYMVGDQLAQFLIVSAVIALVYFAVGKRFRRSEGTVTGFRRLLLLYCITMFLMPVMSTVSSVLRGGEYNILFVLFSFCEALICFLLIGVQIETMQEMHRQSRENMINGLLAQSQKQYEALKDHIDIINIKCHDLRHRIRHIGDAENSDRYLAELEESIDIYDSTIKTGNEILDVILTDKSLRMNAAGIQFTCIADGGKLAFMEEGDISALFGNALENAMEYELGVENAEKRYISLNVQAAGALLYIIVENYFEGELQIKNGLPVTTKADTKNHGFGVKSMARIAEKYGGTLSVKAEDELFKLGIIIPLSL